MDKITCKEDLKKNLLTVERYLAGTDEEKSRMVDLIKAGRCFVCYNYEGNVRFAPSRFVGYKENTLNKHDANGDKDGKITNPAIDGALKPATRSEDNQMNEFLEKFCQGNGVLLDKKSHSFWKSDISFTNDDVVRNWENNENQIAQRIVAKMSQMMGRNSLTLVDQENPIGRDNKILFIQYKPSYAEDSWRKNGCHYEFRISKDKICIEFHSESKGCDLEMCKNLLPDVKYDKWQKGFRLTPPNGQILFTEQNFVDVASNRMVEFEKEYGKKILQLLGQKDLSMINDTLKLLIANHNIILHGAPGTGKTYLAKDIASEMIFGVPQDKLTDEQKNLLNEQVDFVQFHQSYDYTDFVEGLRPVLGDNGKADGFECKEGVFKSFCKKALLNTERINFVPEFDAKYRDFLEYISENDVELETKARHKKFNVVPNSKNMYVVPQTENKHPMPITKEMILHYLETNVALEWKSYVPAIADKMKEVCNLAIGPKSNQKSDEKFVFIIDEINRGEMSKIFGELFYSIDPGYRGKKGKVRTQYANMQEEPNEFDDSLEIKEPQKYGHFYVPENVYIIGTMNDIDRSVESMDFAMRRRFAFKEVTAEKSMGMFENPESWKNSKNEPVNVNAELEHIKNRMKNLNDAILKEEFNLGPAYQIGAAYFLKFAKYYDGTNASAAFNDLWNYHLEGVLKEYLRGLPDEKGLLKKLKEAYDKQEPVSEDKKPESDEG